MLGWMVGNLEGMFDGWADGWADGWIVGSLDGWELGFREGCLEHRKYEYEQLLPSKYSYSPFHVISDFSLKDKQKIL